MYAFQSISVSARVRVRSSPYRMSATCTHRELVGPTLPHSVQCGLITHSLIHSRTRSLACRARPRTKSTSCEPSLATVRQACEMKGVVAGGGSLAGGISLACAACG
jgi:hypothetical protein